MFAHGQIRIVEDAFNIAVNGSNFISEILNLFIPVTFFFRLFIVEKTSRIQIQLKFGSSQNHYRIVSQPAVYQLSKIFLRILFSMNEEHLLRLLAKSGNPGKQTVLIGMTGKSF